MSYYVSRSYLLSLICCYGLLATGEENYVNKVKRDVNEHCNIMNPILQSSLKCFKNCNGSEAFPACIPFASAQVTGNYTNHITVQFEKFGIEPQSRKIFEETITNMMERTKKNYKKLQSIENELSNNATPEWKEFLTSEKNSLEKKFEPIKNLNEEAVNKARQLLLIYQKCINDSSSPSDIINCKKSLASELIKTGKLLKKQQQELFPRKK